jgi:hypothetical protein
VYREMALRAWNHHAENHTWGKSAEKINAYLAEISLAG